MTNTILKTLSVALIVLLSLSPVFAQISVKAIPPSFQPEFEAVFHTQRLPVTRTPALDMKQIKMEDAALDGTVRFAAPLKVNYSPDKVGTWMTLPNGDRVWRLHLTVPDALGLFVVYEAFQLPTGAQFFMYDPSNDQLKGAYTEKNNKPHQKFMTGMIKGHSAILEYYEPRGTVKQLPFVINQLYVAYNTDHIEPPQTEFNAYDGGEGFGDAMSCNVNINCPTGDDWQNHKRGIVRMLRIFDEGVGWCTGSLINNTNEDGTPYLLSAFHCIAGFTPQLELWRFDFNYEAAGCSNPTEEPSYQSLLGCQYRAGREQTDFLLLELEDDIPSSYNAFYNGWNREDTFVPSSATGIHHARGDIKKISIDNDPAIIFNNSIMWSNGVTTPPNHHFRLELDEGTIEDGSSGSPLFDQNGWITGQLHGGNTNCGTNTFITYYGRFSISWDEGTTAATRLKDWLDPANTGQLILGTYEMAVANITGNVRTNLDEDLAGVKVVLSGAVSDSTTTAIDGAFSFEGLPAGENYVLSFSKDTNPLNGVNLLDIIKISEHILGIEPFVDPFQNEAADVSQNGIITGFDLVEIRKVILGISLEFPELASWEFVESTIEVNNLLEDQYIEAQGLKIGDVNFNANPSN